MPKTTAPEKGKPEENSTRFIKTATGFIMIGKGEQSKSLFHLFPLMIFEN